MGDVTQILAQLDDGDAVASDRLLPLVYDELRKLAAARLASEKPGQTLQATALVHEAYLRLVGKDAHVPFNSRAHFFAAAALAMQRILVEQARRKLSQKRGQGRIRVELDDQIPLIKDEDGAARVLAVNEALDALQAEQPRKAELVRLRYFAGMSLEEAAAVLGVSPTTAKRDWAFARAWLFGHLNAPDE